MQREMREIIRHCHPFQVSIPFPRHNKKKMSLPGLRKNVAYTSVKKRYTWLSLDRRGWYETGRSGEGAPHAVWLEAERVAQPCYQKQPMGQSWRADGASCHWCPMQEALWKYENQAREDTKKGEEEWGWPAAENHPWCIVIKKQRNIWDIMAKAFSTTRRARDNL